MPDLRVRRLALALVALLVTGTLAACSQVPDQTTIVMGGDDDGLNGAVLTTPYAVPKVALHDTELSRLASDHLPIKAVVHLPGEDRQAH